MLADVSTEPDLSMWFSKLAVAVWVMTASAAAQELPPDMLLLAHIKSHMREELSHLPNYTCLVTTARFHKEADQHSKLQPLDTVRLEIVYSNHREWYGSPGDRNLSEDNPKAFIGGGLIGNGAFAITLNNVFLAGGATFRYRGEESLDHRMAARYDFHVPRQMAGFQISMIGGVGNVGEEGTFWADPQSLDLIRLESRANEIPPYLPLHEMILSMNYARTQVGAYSALLAQHADMHMVKISGEESYNRLDFTHCRAFLAESTLRFDPEPEHIATSIPPNYPKLRSQDEVTRDVVPALLRVTVQLTTPITEKEAVGKLIEAKVYGDVVYKGKIIIPHGSLVRGRIRRLERYGAGEDHVVGLEFMEVAVNGRSMRFYADLIKMDRGPKIRTKLFVEKVVIRSARFESKYETITLPELPGVASFFIHGRTFVLPSGFRTIWRTRGLIRN